LQTNCYILQSDSAALLVDPGDEPERILRFLNDLSVKPSRIIATHTHFDHVLGVDAIRAKLKIPFLIHEDDLSMLESMQSRLRQIMGFSVPPPPNVDQFLKNGESIAFGQEKVKVIHTPGHSPRTDLPGGDFDTLVRSIAERLFSLGDDTIVYPGHGPETSIGDEKLANPFVGQVAKRLT